MLPPWRPGLAAAGALPTARGVVEAEEAVKAELFRIRAGQARKTQTFQKLVSNTAEIRVLLFTAGLLYLTLSTPCCCM